MQRLLNYKTNIVLSNFVIPCRLFSSYYVLRNSLGSIEYKLMDMTENLENIVSSSRVDLVLYYRWHCVLHNVALNYIILTDNDVHGIS